MWINDMGPRIVTTTAGALRELADKMQDEAKKAALLAATGDHPDNLVMYVPATQLAAEVSNAELQGPERPEMDHRLDASEGEETS